MTIPQPDRGLFRNFRGIRRENRTADAFRQAAGAAIERLALMYAVMLFCGVATFGSATDNIGSLQSNPISFYSNLFMLILFGLLTLFNLRKTADFLPFSHLLAVFVALAILSTLWSVVPGVTLRRIVSLVTTLLISIHLTWRFDFAKAVSIMGHALLVVCVLSLLTVIFLPHLGITQVTISTDELAGTWKGVLPTKNSLGWVGIAGVQVYAWRFLVEREKRLRHSATIAFFIFITAETRSATALICVTFSMILIALLGLRRWQSAKRGALEWLFLGAVGLVVCATLLAPADILALFNKSSDLTGRIPLWHDVLVSIRRQPLFGYGYGAFWLETNPEALRIWALNPWKPPDAHNGYLEVTLQLGLVGLALAVALLLVSIKRALAWCKLPDSTWAVYVGSFLIVYAVTSFDETQFFRGGDLLCLQFAFCYFTLLRRKRLDASARLRNAEGGVADAESRSRKTPAKLFLR